MKPGERNHARLDGPEELQEHIQKLIEAIKPGVVTLARLHPKSDLGSFSMSRRTLTVFSTDRAKGAAAVLEVNRVFGPARTSASLPAEAFKGSSHSRHA